MRLQPKASRRLLALVMCALLLAPALAACTSMGDLGFADPVQPRLANNEPARRGPVINEAAFNRGAIRATLAPYAGYVGKIRVSYAGDRSQVQNDLNELGTVAPQDFDPNAVVTVDFTDASLNYILDQLLRGALGVNFVAPNNLPAHIDFHLDAPLPKSRVIQVVRDLLSRNGFVMRLIDGVYQIGSADAIIALEANSAQGRTGDDITQVVDLGAGNAAKVVALAQQLLPQNVTVMVSSASNKIVVKANPNDMPSIRQMLQSLSNLATDDEQVAIIPLHRSAPEAVATQLTQFYSGLLTDGTERVAVIPLQDQQAVLVGASSAPLMRGVQQLALQMDRSDTDASALRVIALTHRKAADLVPQLSQLFGASTGPQAVAATSSMPIQATTGVASRLSIPSGITPMTTPLGGDNNEGNSLSVPPPLSVAPGAQSGGANAAGLPANQATATAAPATPIPPDSAPKIVADESTNSILVYSTYAIYKRMRDVVQTLDVAEAQVVIEATVLEVDLNNELQNGVEFFLQSHGISIGSGVPSGSSSPSAGGMFGVSANIGDVSADLVMSALRQVTKLRVVSSPYLTVIDGQPARLVIGDQIPFATSTQTSSNTGGTTITRNVQILDTGVVLQITPTIHANNSVDLNIVQSVSTPKGENGADLTPTVSTRDISSQILAQSGRTVLLGGMIQDRTSANKTGVPGIGDLPVIGNLFSQQDHTSERTELLVLITPRVVRNSSGIENITRQLQQAAAHRY